MLFRRPQVRYSATPAPTTPYQAAAQVWDERIGSARVPFVVVAHDTPRRNLRIAPTFYQSGIRSWPTPRKGDKPRPVRHVAP